MGHSIPSESAIKLSKELDEQETAMEQLTAHPNFEEPNPNKFRDVVHYTLYYVAAMISPKQEKGEDYEIECVDIARALMSRDLCNRIKTKWLEKDLKDEKRSNKKG